LSLIAFLSRSESTLLVIAVLCYCAAMLALWAQLFLRSEGATPHHHTTRVFGSRILLWLGAGVHALSLVGQGSTLFAVKDGVVGLFGWSLLLAFLIFGNRLGREIALGAFVTPVVLIATLYSLAAPLLHRFTPASQHAVPWLIIHVIVILISYVALAFAFAASLIYLLQDSLLKRKQLGGLWQKLPSLQVADEWIYRATSFGLAALTVGLLTGVLWQHDHPGYAALRDPKVLISFATWFIFAIYLVARWRLGWRGRKSNWVVVGGFLLLAISFLGTPHLLNGIS
jgi:ABC-type uncharacterized transport system permease subunit